MSDEIFDFKWLFSESGYRLVEGQGGGVLQRSPDGSSELFVTDSRELGSASTYIRYNPLRMYPDLFLQFSRLALEEDSILGFANTHGLLTDEGLFTTEEPNLGISGEALSYWKHQIEVMKEMVDVWALQKQNSPKLSEYIKWHGNSVRYKSRSRSFILAGPDDRPDWFRRWRRGENRGPALMALQIVINDYTSKLVGTKILWNRNGTSMAHYFVPRNLLGAMWLQFARALVREKKYRPCQVCGAVMEISTDPHSRGKRADTLLCGDKCRSQKQRDKQKAKELKQLGLSLRSIRPQLIGNYSRDVFKDWRV